MIFPPINQKHYNIIGIMTGTSMDSIDVSFCKFQNINLENLENLDKNSEIKNTNLSYELIAFKEYDFPASYKELIKSNINNSTTVSVISLLNFYLSEIFYECLTDFIDKFNLKPNEIDAISVHGQTIWHQPNGDLIDGKLIKHTLQIFNGSVLAKKINIPVIFDFRSADIALSGQGAPLVPIFDYHYFGQKDKTIIAANIGGISNITILNNKNKNNIIAFDTGPGNMLIDFCMKKYFDLEYDNNGEYASKGEIIEELLNLLLDNSYFDKAPPKSTGRELFGETYLDDILSKLEKDNIINFLTPNIKYDIIRTVTELTIKSFANQILRFVNYKKDDKTKLQTKQMIKIIISGGGTYNSFLINRIKSELVDFEIVISDEIGLISKTKESIAFAFLGFLFLTNQNGNIKSVTGAKRETRLGVIAL